MSINLEKYKIKNSINLEKYRTKQTPQDLSLGDKIKEDISKRQATVRKGLESGQSPLMTGYQMATQGAGAVSDVIGEGFSKALSYTPEFIKKPIQGAVSGIAKGINENPTVSAAKELASTNIDAFIKKYPTTAKLLEGGVAVGELAINKSIAEDVAKLYVKGVKTIVPKVINKVAETLPNKVKAINELEQTWESVLTGTAGKKKLAKMETKTTSQNLAGTEGKMPTRKLAEDGIFPNNNGTVLDTLDQAQQYKQTIKPLNEINKEGLSKLPELTSLDELEREAINLAKTSKNINSGKFYSMESEIKKEFALLKRSHPKMINQTLVDEIKTARWENVFKNKGLIDADILKKNSEYIIAKSLQKNIEKVATKAGNKEVAQLNREIGDRLDALKFLEDVNGKTIKGGAMIKVATTAIGASMGNTLLGRAIGAIGGNAIGSLLISNSLGSPIKRLLLRNLKITNPKAYEETIKWLEQQALDKETRLLLPAPKTIYGEAYKGGESSFVPSGTVTPTVLSSDFKGILTPRKLNLSKGQNVLQLGNPQRGTKFQDILSKSPNKKQTTSATIKASNINKSISHGNGFVDSLRKSGGSLTLDLRNKALKQNIEKWANNYSDYAKEQFNKPQ